MNIHAVQCISLVCDLILNGKDVLLHIEMASFEFNSESLESIIKVEPEKFEIVPEDGTLRSMENK